MREKIIFAPELNENEMLKNMALHGVKCFNLHIFNDIKLAQYALMRNGIYDKQQPISTVEENAIMLRALECTNYFGNVTFSDVREISSAVRNMRMLVSDEDEKAAIRKVLEKGEFKEKNEAIYKVYDEYMNILEAEALIDRIGIIRNALIKCAPLEVDFCVLQGSVLNPVQKALIHKLSNGKYKEIKLSELYNIDDTSSSDKKVELQYIKNCYGVANEIETALQEIYEGKMLDTCTIAVTNYNSYCQQFYDYAIHHNVPIAFGKGIPIINSSPAILLSMYNHWMYDAFFGGEALTAMIKSSAFNKSKLKEVFGNLPENFSWNGFYKVVGQIRLTNDNEINTKRINDFEKAIKAKKEIKKEDKEYKELQLKKECIPYIKLMANELALPIEDFISKYAIVRWKEEKNANSIYETLDLTAKRVIYNELKVITDINDSQAVGDIIQNILQKNICNSSAKAGTIYLTDIPGAMSCMRDNLFVVGLSASNYPGKPKENYLLLDTDIRCFGEDASFLLSTERIKNKSSQLMRLVRFATQLDARIYISYAGLNVSDLKNDNASSMVYELFKEEKGDSATADELSKNTDTVGYFEPRISNTRNIGLAYNKGEIIENEGIPHFDGEIDLSGCLEKSYSPTSVVDFVKCPRLFALKNLFGVSEARRDSAFQVASALDTGNMMHTLMQKIANKKADENTFVAMAADVFDNFILEHPPIISQSIDSEKKQFMDMARIAYMGRPTGEVIMQEKDISCVHETGVKLHGYPDCVEKLADGSVRVIDYKTNKNVEHVENDPLSCIQVMIYGYILEKMGYKVSSGEYRYLCLGETISCVYNDDTKSIFNKKMKLLRKYLDEISNFICKMPDIEEDVCKECMLVNLCKKGWGDR